MTRKHNKSGSRKKNRSSPKDINTPNLPDNKTKLIAILVFCVVIASVVFIYFFIQKPNSGPLVIDRSINFPRDGGTHNELMEIWSFSGSFRNEQGNTFGYHVNYIGSGTRHSSFTDETNLTGSPYYFTQDIPTSKQNPDLNIQVSNKSLDLTYVNTGVIDRMVGSETGTDTFTLDSSMNMQSTRFLNLNITLKANKKPLLFGDEGKVYLMSYGTMYWYQFTNLTISGTMNLSGQTHTITGYGRIEHVWGSNGIVGSIELWNLMLSNGKEICVARMYQPGTQDIFLEYDYLIDSDGTYDVTTYSDVNPLKPNFTYLDYQTQNMSIRERSYWLDPYDSQQKRCFAHTWRFLSERNHYDLQIDPTVEYQANFEGYVGTVQMSGTFKGLSTSGQGHVSLLITYDSTLELLNVSDTSSYNNEYEIPNDPVKVSVELDAGLPLQTALVYYRVNGGENKSIALVQENEDSNYWNATIPGQSLGTQVEYWIYADNMAGKWIKTEAITYFVKIGS